MKIIGIFGQLASGKDTVANDIVKNFNGDDNGIHDWGLGPQKWKRLGFADAVKHVFMQSFNVTWEWIEEWKRKDEVPPGFDLTVRKGLQYIGDGFRKIQSDVWIQTALRNGECSVISDGRYLNEAKMIKEKGGLNILLWRPGFENDDPNPSESQIKPYIQFCSSHHKEGPLLHNPKDIPGMEFFDYFLINDGTVEDLYTKIQSGLMHYLQEIK